MKYLIVCGSDRSKHKVALSILKYFLNQHKKEKKDIFVCVLDKDKVICKLLTKKGVKFITKGIEKFLLNVEKDSFDWLLNIWGSIIYKKETLKKFKNNINLHPSYLPFAKGKDPYVWSIQSEYPLGVTIHEMNSQIDSGKYFIRKKILLDFPYNAGDVFDLSLKQCILEFKKNWLNILNKKIKKKKFLESKTKIYKRIDLINDNILNLDKKININLRKFFLKILSQDFNFNKLQIMYNKSIFDISLNIKKSKKKNWYK